MWTPDCQLALDTLKKALSSQSILAPPDYSKLFILQTDLPAAVSVLFYLKHHISIYSHKFLDRERRYDTMEKEGLAIVEACKHFLPYLARKKFCVVTDNRAPQYLYNKDPTTGCLARWLDARRDLDFEV